VQAIELQQRYIFRPDVVVTLLDEGAVLLDLDSKFFYRLNRTGWAIAQLFESGANIAQVRDRCAQLGAQPSDTQAIDNLFQALSNDHLIQPVDEQADPVDAPQSVSTDPWVPPTIERQAEPLQRVIISAFDPSVPLVE
jgi:hypothetical protein